MSATRVPWMVTGLVLVVLLAACGGSGDDAVTGAGADAPTDAAETEADTEAGAASESEPADDAASEEETASASEDMASESASDDMASESASAASSGCTEEEVAGAADAPPVELQFSTASTPEQHHTKAAYEFQTLVGELSGGSVTVEVFDSGSLYDQTSEQTALLQGNVDMAYSAANWVSERVPEAGIAGVPYLIDDVEHLYEVMDGEVGEEIFAATVEQAGIRPLTTLYLGTRQLNLVEDVGEVMTPEDLAGVNLRVPDSPSWIRMGQAMGASPTPVAFNELYLALQTGTVDGQENPLPTTRDAGFYEVTDQLSLTAHLVDFVWPTINEGVWQSLAPEQQEAIQQAWVCARDFGTDIIVEEEADVIAFFEEEGLEVYEPDREAFRETVLPTYLEDEALTSGWGEGHLETIQELRG